METYKVKVINGIVGASFTIYMNDYEGRVAGGRVDTPEFIINIPVKYEGYGKMKVFYRNRSRTFQSVAYSIPFEIYPGRNNEISFVRENREESPAPKTEKETASASTSDNEGGLSTIEKIKDVTENELRGKIQEKKTGNSFWDNLK